MFVREFGWRGLVMGLMLGLGLLALGGKAVALDYAGDKMCNVCHNDKYSTYIKHGHPLKLVHTAGQQPPANLYPWGQTLPALPNNVQWADVEYIMRGSSGAGTFRFYGGNRGTRHFDGHQIDLVTGNATSATSGYTCGKCHTAGYTDYPQINKLPDPDPTHHQSGLPWIQGIWALEGIQCEACHGAGGAHYTNIKPPPPNPTAMECQTCHTADDKMPDGTLSRRMQFDAAGALYGGTYGWLSGSHSQGDEFLHSPHKAVKNAQGELRGCALCHDPHKSVWHDDGGVKYSEEHGVGNMCKECHKDKRVRGAMGEEGIDLECIDCHMPDASMKGAGASHLFRINTTALAAKDNTHTESDSGAKTWWNTDQNGDASLTLDLLCTKCHAKSMTLGQMAKAAKAIHRQPGLVDLTVNNGDGLQLVKKTTPVSVDFSLLADAKAGMKADWWVICQGPKGWSSWDGKKWKAGLRPWRKGVALADVPKQNVLSAKLSPGYYTYWVSIAPTDGSMNFDGVLVYVTP